MSCKLTKNEIRKKNIYKRNQYSIDLFHKLNSSVKINLMKLFETLNVKNGNQTNIFTYLSVFERGEVDTWGIIEFLQNNIGIDSIYVPKINGKDMTETLYRNNFYKNKYGIFECEESKNPFSNNFVSQGVIPDIVIVPLLAFNTQGHRIGYGGGFYDKYLSDRKTKNKNIITIGLSFENHSTDNWAVKEYDVPLNYVVTSTKIYEF